MIFSIGSFLLSVVFIKICFSNENRCLRKKTKCLQIKITHLLLSPRHSAYSPAAAQSPDSYHPGWKFLWLGDSRIILSSQTGKGPFFNHKEKTKKVVIHSDIKLLLPMEDAEKTEVSPKHFWKTLKSGHRSQPWPGLENNRVPLTWFSKIQTMPLCWT